MWDITLAMGAEIPHWYNGNECLINETIAYLEEGEFDGWYAISKE